jgi:adenine deaminase
LQGYAERIEGIASTFNTAMDILVIGQNPGSMASAVNRVLQMRGGDVAHLGFMMLYLLLAAAFLLLKSGWVTPKTGS